MKAYKYIPHEYMNPSDVLTKSTEALLGVRVRLLLGRLRIGLRVFLRGPVIRLD